MKFAIRARANNQWVCADDTIAEVQADGTVVKKLAPSRPLQANREAETPTEWEELDFQVQVHDGDPWVPLESLLALPTPEPIPPEPTPEGGLPAINSQNFRVYGSDPACLDFPETAQFTAFGIVADSSESGTLFLSSDGCENWPAVVIDDTGNPSQNATLWVLEKIQGAWCATGAERLRPGQSDGTKPTGVPPTVIGNSWLYDPSRWGPMALHNPMPGETVGFIIVAGSTRSDNQTPVKARTNVVWVQWPAAAGANPAAIATGV